MCFYFCIVRAGVDRLYCLNHDYYVFKYIKYYYKCIGDATGSDFIETYKDIVGNFGIHKEKLFPAVIMFVEDA